jgi:HSP20 family protein
MDLAEARRDRPIPQGGTEMPKTMIPTKQDGHGSEVAVAPTRELHESPWAWMESWLGLPRVFQDLVPEAWFAERERRITPSIDLSEDEDVYVVTAEVPGMTKDDLEIKIDRGVLSISGEKKAETERKGRNLHRVERRYGSVFRSVQLPSDVKSSDAEATFRDGVLEIRLPKQEGARPTNIRIR